jgi:hypothetical protein
LAGLGVELSEKWVKTWLFKYEFFFFFFFFFLSQHKEMYTKSAGLGVFEGVLRGFWCQNGARYRFLHRKHIKKYSFVGKFAQKRLKKPEKHPRIQKKSPKSTVLYCKKAPKTKKWHQKPPFYM